MKIAINYTIELDKEEKALLRQHYEENKGSDESFREMVRSYFISDGQFQLDERINKQKKHNDWLQEAVEANRKFEEQR